MIKINKGTEPETLREYRFSLAPKDREGKKVYEDFRHKSEEACSSNEAGNLRRQLFVRGCMPARRTVRREVQHYGGSLAQRTGDVQRAVVELHHGVHQRQPKPGSFNISRQRPVYLIERFNYLFDLVGCDADSVVGDRNYQFAFVIDG